MFRIINEVPNQKPQMQEISCGSLARYELQNIKLTEGQKVSLFHRGRMIQSFSIPDKKDKRK